MGISDSLEIAIGLSFIFMMLSLVLTSVNEMIESVLKARGRQLFEGVGQMLARQGDPAARPGEDAARTIYSHPLIQSLMRGDVGKLVGNAARWGTHLPSYVPTRNFALALIDQVREGHFAPAAIRAAAGDTQEQADVRARAAAKASLPVAASPVEQLRFAAERIDNEQIRRVLAQAAETAGNDLAALETYLQNWFDSGMDRVSGWYKRRTQRITFVLGLLIAVLLNVNTVTIADRLLKEPTLRRSVIAQAGLLSKDNAPLLTSRQANAAIEQTGLPVGWTETAITALRDPIILGPNPSGRSYARVALGLVEIVMGFLVTAFAVTLGAPFWFDVLNRLMVIRATVKPTEKSKDEASQDPQPTPRTGDATVVVTRAAEPAPAPAPPIDTDVYADAAAAFPGLFESDDGAADGDRPQ